MTKKKDMPDCSWCQDEEAHVEISLDDENHVLTLYLGASCLYQTITHAIGNPRKVHLNTHESSGIVN
jgi:hypothetical protein